MPLPRTGWFKAALGFGFLLGAVLLVRIYIAYRYVASELALDHVSVEVGLVVSRLEQRARSGRADTVPALEHLMEATVAGQDDLLAWIRVADQEGAALAVAGRPPDRPLDREAVRTVLTLGRQSVTTRQSTPDGDFIVVVMPFRYRLRDVRPATPETPGAGNVPRFMLAELGVRPEGFPNPFQALRRSLALSTLAAIALMAAMVIGAIRFPAYLRGRQLEQQLAVARRVQQGLLPGRTPVQPGLEVAATFEPNWEVGGDYYDLFATAAGEVALVLADVSGKGLPAALVMGLVHGALRTASALAGTTSHAHLVSELNELLLARTSEERYVSLFWGALDPMSHRLRYVNAGHLPPSVVRRHRDGTFEVCRLETGGPVVGLLPAVSYEQGEFFLRPDDQLVLYSDGLVEATNAGGEEFGEERLRRAVEAAWSRPAIGLRDEIVRELRSFIGPRPLQDDLTVLVVKVARTA